MPPQAAAVAIPNTAEELQPKAEAAVESGKSPESALEQALGSEKIENVVSIFRGRANQEKQALARLGEMDAEELESSPDATAQVEAANNASYKQIDQAEEQAIQEIVGVMEPANEPMEAPEPKVVEMQAASVVEPVPVVEAVKVAPTIAVEEAPKVEVKAERNEIAEQQKLEAEESMKADLEALQGYAQEHRLTLDAEHNIPDAQLQGLLPVERTYVAVLQTKYKAAEASKLHAEALMAVAAETDPAKKKQLAQEAFALSEDAALKEKAATMMNAQYMNLPEIAAMVGLGNPTGGSYGGNAFEAPPSGPSSGGPEDGGGGPPDLRVIQGGKGSYTSAPMYTGGGVSGDGIAKIEAYKTPDAKVTPRKPNFIERFFNRNVKDLTYGEIDPEKKGRE